MKFKSFERIVYSKAKASFENLIFIDSDDVLEFQISYKGSVYKFV